MQQAYPGQHLGENLRQRARRGDRRHGSGEDERRDDAGLVVARIDLGGAEHGGVEGHGRIGVDKRSDHGFFAQEVLAKQDFRHRHRVLRPFRVGDRAHERLVAVAQVGVDHVQMALVDGNVHRLADRAPGMVHVGRQVGELHEILKVRQGGVAPPALEVTHERRSVTWREHRVRAANADAAAGVAGVLDEFPGRMGLDDGSAQTSRKAHPFVLHLSARFL